ASILDPACETNAQARVQIPERRRVGGGAEEERGPASRADHEDARQVRRRRRRFGRRLTARSVLLRRRAISSALAPGREREEERREKEEGEGSSRRPRSHAARIADARPATKILPGRVSAKSGRDSAVSEAELDPEEVRDFLGDGLRDALEPRFDGRA